jgi:hypothetical protein
VKLASSMQLEDVGSDTQIVMRNKY